MGEMITIPVEEYRALKLAAEDLDELTAFDRVKAALAAGDDETIPAEAVKRMLEGESPLRVFRELRALTQAALADKSGVNRVQISNIEDGSRRGSVDTLRKLADALGVTIDDLV